MWMLDHLSQTHLTPRLKPLHRTTRTRVKQCRPPDTQVRHYWQWISKKLQVTEKESAWCVFVPSSHGNSTEILNCSNSNNSIPHSTQSSSHSFHWSHQPDIPRRQWLSSYISNLSTRRRSSILLRKVHGINIIKAVSDFFSGSHFSWLCLDPPFPPPGQSLPIFCPCEMASNPAVPAGGIPLPPVWPWRLAGLLCGVTSGASPITVSRLKF